MSPSPARLLMGLGGLAVLSLLLALLSGPINLDWTALWGSGNPLSQQLLQEIRLPRAMGAFVCGGLLALSGALIQALLRNPLGDPYILGVSGGASTGALIGLLLNLGEPGLTLVAALGAFIAILLVFSLNAVRGATTERLLLTGIVMAAAWGALVNLILALSSAQQLPGMLFWLMGDLAQVRWPGIAGLILLTGVGLGLWLAPQLNLLLQGEWQATALGVEVRYLRIAVFLLASVLTASAVTLAGNVGFVGLIAPHLFRLAGGNDHRWLLPGSVLLGASLVLLADTLARTLIAPAELPLGALTALIGVPLFLYLLQRR